MYKTTEHAFWCTRKLHGIVWNTGHLDYSELWSVFPRVLRAEYFAKGTEKWKILGDLLDKEVENLEDHGCPRFQDLVDEEV